jgi:hypothetical protein
MIMVDRFKERWLGSGKMTLRWETLKNIVETMDAFANRFRSP